MLYYFLTACANMSAPAGYSYFFDYARAASAVLAFTAIDLSKIKVVTLFALCIYVVSRRATAQLNTSLHNLAQT